MFDGERCEKPISQYLQVTLYPWNPNEYHQCCDSTTFHDQKCMHHHDFVSNRIVVHALNLFVLYWKNKLLFDFYITRFLIIPVCEHLSHYVTKTKNIFSLIFLSVLLSFHELELSISVSLCPLCKTTTTEYWAFRKIDDRFRGACVSGNPTDCPLCGIVCYSPLSSHAAFRVFLPIRYIYRLKRRSKWTAMAIL